MNIAMKDPINSKYHLKRKLIHPASYYVDGILQGNNNILGQAITLVESEQDKHATLAGEIVSACIHKAGSSFRLGITGSPGVGKSSFVNVFWETNSWERSSSGYTCCRPKQSAHTGLDFGR